MRNKQSEVLEFHEESWFAQKDTGRKPLTTTGTKQVLPYFVTDI